MNLLAAPWSESLDRATVVLTHRRLRIPIICFAASLLFMGVGSAVLSSQVTVAESMREKLAQRRAAFDRAIIGTHVRERRLRRDLKVARRIAAVRRDANDMVAAIADIANAAPPSVWFGTLTIDQHELKIDAKTDSLLAISSMLRSSSHLLRGKRSSVRTIARAPSATNPVISFTLEVQRGS